MGATSRLSVSELTVTPGGEAVLDVLVENNGGVVDEFAVEALGDAALWAEATPSSVRLLPGGEAAVKLVFRPPREARSLAGVVPFAVKVSSKEDPEGTVVEEGVLAVEPFAEASADLLPSASHGRRRARYHVAVDNRGNSPLSAEVAPSDDTGELRFKLRPAALEVEPDSAAFSELVVIPRRRFWRGPAKPRPFGVPVNRPNQAPLPLSDTMLHEALIPSWAGALALALVAALVAAAVLWSGVLKPAIQSTAKGAAVAAGAAPLKQQNAELKKQSDALKQQGDQLKKQGDALAAGGNPPAAGAGGAAPGGAGSANPQAAGAGTGAGGSGGGATGAAGSGGSAAGNSLGAPIDARLDSKN